MEIFDNLCSWKSTNLQKSKDLQPENFADMRKRDLCRSLVVQVCRGLFDEALVGSPALQALVDLHTEIFAYLQTCRIIAVHTPLLVLTVCC